MTGPAPTDAHASGDAGTGSWSAVWLVAKREIRTRFLAKSNLISLGIMVALIIAGGFLAAYFIDRDSEGPTMAIATDESASALSAELEATAARSGTELELRTMPEAAAREALAADELDAFLSGDPQQPVLLLNSVTDSGLIGFVTEAVQQHVIAHYVSGLGGDAAQVGEAVAGAVPVVTTLDEDEGRQFGPTYLVAVSTISLLLFALIGTGSLIAMGVVEEKTSRVVELLLATIRPSQLLAGKILGIGIVGLGQILVLSGAAIGTLAATGLLSGFDISLSSALVVTLLWFLLGFAVFSLLFGGFAALISRQEEIGSVTTPLMFLLFVPFYLSMFMVSSNPDGPAVRVLSQIPVFSPFMMPMRSVYDAVTIWEMLLAMGIALLTVPLLTWIAARVYRRGVLHTGGRMRLREALRG
ncbi:MAG TPA: ABC transporter permease [Actinomycetaceae bacterium]|nr:ABC transporter permease [Actinomycetaceae bacterium]